MEEEPVPEEPTPIANPIQTLNLENFTKAEIISRLERLLDVNLLRREMEQVGGFFIF